MLQTENLTLFAKWNERKTTTFLPWLEVNEKIISLAWGASNIKQQYVPKVKQNEIAINYYQQAILKIYLHGMINEQFLLYWSLITYI